jgi:hypothetical protein
MRGGMASRTHLTDFGLAKNVRTGSRYTRTGETLGSPASTSPELARGEFDADTAAARPGSVPTSAWSWATARANLGAVCYQHQRWAEAAAESRLLLRVAGNEPRFAEARRALAECERRLAEAPAPDRR